MTASLAKGHVRLCLLPDLLRGRLASLAGDRAFERGKARQPPWPPPLEVVKSGYVRDHLLPLLIGGAGEREEGLG